VRLRLHPTWLGTVVGRSLSAGVSVNWDNHGIETTHRDLLELVCSAHDSQTLTEIGRIKRN
jgi:hypothetical protein